jgi:hypothetical protein
VSPAVDLLNPSLTQDPHRYSFQNWVYHLVSGTNHHPTVLDEVIRFIDTTLEEFGLWMTRVELHEAVRRIKEDLTSSQIRLRQSQHLLLSRKIGIVIERVEVRQFVIRRP